MTAYVYLFLAALVMGLGANIIGVTYKYSGWKGFVGMFAGIMAILCGSDLWDHALTLL